MKRKKIQITSSTLYLISLKDLLRILMRQIKQWRIIALLLVEKAIKNADSNFNKSHIY